MIFLLSFFSYYFMFCLLFILFWQSVYRSAILFSFFPLHEEKIAGHVQDIDRTKAI